MQGKAGSRKRITLNYPREIVRIILLLCLLVSAAAFAASRDKSPLRVYARSAQPVPISRSLRPSSGQSAVVSTSRSPIVQPRQAVAVANVEPFIESTSFRVLWLIAGFGLVFRSEERR